MNRRRGSVKAKLIWTVLRHDINSDSFEKFNVFDHYGFSSSVEKLLKGRNRIKDRYEFAVKLSSEVIYYFWCKAEHELILTKRDNQDKSIYLISPWCGSRNNPILDVSSDEDFDWSGFYSWISQDKCDKDGSIKIDIYDQIRYRWNEFVDYVWSFRAKERRKREVTDEA